MVRVMKKTLLLMVLFVVTGVVSAQAQLLVDVQFGGNCYGSYNADQQTGAGLVGNAGDQWNNIAFSSDVYTTSTPFTTSLNNVGGTASGVSLNIAPSQGVLSEYSTGSQLPGTPLANLYEGFLDADTGTYTNAGGNVSSTFTFSGLTAGQSYNLYVYSAPNHDRESTWSLNSSTPVQVGPNSGATTLVSPNNYLLLTGTADVSGNLILQAATVGGDEIDVNGFQLQAQSVPEPSTYALMLGGILALIAFRRKNRLSV